MTRATARSRHPSGAPARAAECPWKLTAMSLVAAIVVILCGGRPEPLNQLIPQGTRIIGGAS
jgi:hypothetical protein